VAGDKANRPLRAPAFYQLAKCVEDRLETGVIFAFEGANAMRELRILRHHGPHLHKSANDVNAGLHGYSAVQYACQHDCTVFGKNARFMFYILTSFQGRNLRP